MDPEGTYVRRLSLASYSVQLRAVLGNNDPVIVLVDSEIEQAILSMAGDLSKVREHYPSESGIDWVLFQYHLTIMQHAAPNWVDGTGIQDGWKVSLDCSKHVPKDGAS